MTDALRDAAEAAAIWLEEEAEHPRQDPRPAMRLQASLLRAALGSPPRIPDDAWPAAGFLEQPPATSDSTRGLE